MAIELPGPVADFLNFIGIPWINVNEDKVREFGSHVRQFASDVSDVHRSATSTLNQLGSGYSGAAYDALMRMWGTKSTSHISELTSGCGVLADALDVGADFIEGQKIACIGELIGMAAAFAADQAAAVVTLGASEAALPLIEEGAEKLMSFAENEIEQQVIGQIANAALQPLMGKIESLMEGLLIGGGGGGGSAGSGFEVDNEHLDLHASKMQSHADELAGHVQKFTANVSALDFSS